MINMGFGFDAIFNLFPIFFFIVFALVIGVFIATAVKGVTTWRRNNNSPRLTVSATVVSKRSEVGGHHSDEHHHYHTTYFVTFQVESGDRMEFAVDGHESGMLVEGDQGQLTFQGTRYLGFARA